MVMSHSESWQTPYIRAIYVDLHYALFFQGQGDVEIQMTQPRTIAATEERESVVGSSTGCMWWLGLSNVKRGSVSCAALLIMNKFSCDYEGHRGFPCAF